MNSLLISLARRGPLSRPWLQWLEPLPLASFLVYMRLLSPQTPQEWLVPYLLCTLLALVVTVAGWYLRQSLNRIYLAIGAYFLSGLLALVLGWQALNALYGRLEATAMLAWVLVIGTVSTYALPAGFIGIAGAPTTAVRRASLLLLAASGLALLFSACAGRNPLLSAFVPFVFLFVTQGRLRKRLLSDLPEAF